MTLEYIISGNGLWGLSLRGIFLQMFSSCLRKLKGPLVSLGLWSILPKQRITASGPKPQNSDSGGNNVANWLGDAQAVIDPTTSLFRVFILSWNTSAGSAHHTCQPHPEMQIGKVCNSLLSPWSLPSTAPWLGSFHLHHMSTSEVFKSNIGQSLEIQVTSTTQQSTTSSDDMSSNGPFLPLCAVLLGTHEEQAWVQLGIRGFYSPHPVLCTSQEAGIWATSSRLVPPIPPGSNPPPRLHSPCPELPLFHNKSVFPWVTQTHQLRA